MSKLTITTLKNHQGLFKKVVDLIQTSFNYSANNDVTVDFAPLFETEDFHQNHLLINEDKYTVHGHIGYRNKKLLIDGYSVPISIVGGIAISKECRGQGNFNPIFSKVIEECEKDSTFILLWSDKSNLYQKFHFTEVGVTAQTGDKDLNKANLKDWEKHLLKDLSTVEIEQLKELYELQKKNCSVIERDDLAWEKLKDITSANFYIHRDNKNNIDMYFVINKGQDLSSVIHEFGYRDSCKKLFFEQLKDYKLWVPESISPDAPSQYLYTAMIRIGNWDKFKEFVFNWSNGDISIIDGDLDNVTFDFNGDEFELATETLLQYIWGPEKIKEFSAYFKPLYISGLDSL